MYQSAAELADRTSTSKTRPRTPLGRTSTLMPPEGWQRLERLHLCHMALNPGGLLALEACTALTHLELHFVSAIDSRDTGLLLPHVVNAHVAQTCPRPHLVYHVLVPHAAQTRPPPTHGHHVLNPRAAQTRP